MWLHGAGRGGGRVDSGGWGEQGQGRRDFPLLPLEAFPWNGNEVPLRNSIDQEQRNL